MIGGIEFFIKKLHIIVIPVKEVEMTSFRIGKIGKIIRMNEDIGPFAHTQLLMLTFLSQSRHAVNFIMFRSPSSGQSCCFAI
jgi:hypothetical protein